MANNARRRRGGSTITLPTHPVTPSDDLFEYHTAIFGCKGIGKSTLGSQWPNSLNFRFERWRQNLPILQVPKNKQERLTWTDFRAYLNLFCEDDALTTAVIDSLDVAYQECFAHVCQTYGCTHPNEQHDYGQTWKAIEREFESVFHQILDANKRFVLLSHEKTRVIENPDETETQTLDLSATPAAISIVKQFCDIVMYYGRSAQDRILAIRNRDNTIECTCNLDTHFLDPDGDPIYRFWVPHDKHGVLPIILDAWNNKIRDYDWTPPRKTSARSRKSKKTTD